MRLPRKLLRPEIVPAEAGERAAPAGQARADRRLVGDAAAEDVADERLDRVRFGEGHGLAAGRRNGASGKHATVDKRSSPAADRSQPPLAISGERKARPDVFTGQIGKVPEQIVLGHAGREIIENVGHRHAQATDAGLSSALSRLDGDAVSVRHCLSLRDA